MTVVVASSEARLPETAEVIKQAAGENFPVASLFFGRPMRRHVQAVYGFARLVDDTGDEVSGDRDALLGELDAELSRVFGAGMPSHPIMRALKGTVAQCGLPEEPFRRLIEANRLDQVKTRYATFGELESYCQLSAAPLGEIVLHLLGEASPSRVELSNRICAALQVIEHLQDVGEDYGRGRIYLPEEDLRRFGCHEGLLSANRAAPELRAVVALMVGRCHQLLSAGTPLVSELPVRLRLPVAGFVAGGQATLRAIERSDYDVLGARTRGGRADFLRALSRTVVGR